MIWKVIGLSVCGKRGNERELLLAPASSLSQNRWSRLRRWRVKGGGIYACLFCGVYALCFVEYMHLRLWNICAFVCEYGLLCERKLNERISDCVVRCGVDEM